jgi:hypothetical protein
MDRQLAVFVILFHLLVASAVAQQAASVACTFQDGREISLRYDGGASVKKADLSSGKMWTPGEKPMLLFTQAELSIGNSQIPVGAYSLYLIPGKDHWTLVVNKKVDKGEYDAQQDLVRVPMDEGQISNPQPFSLVFAHVAPKQCNLRIYQGKTGAWTEFHEK